MANCQFVNYKPYAWGCLTHVSPLDSEHIWINIHITYDNMTAHLFWNTQVLILILWFYVKLTGWNYTEIWTDATSAKEFLFFKNSHYILHYLLWVT